MLEMDKVINQRLSSDVPLVSEVARYIIAAGGKRLRPALLLLMCGALECSDVRRFSLAAVIEFIHTATLLHDDVVDESTLRRGQATANQTFGNSASVLVGDFLHSRSFQMMVEVGDLEIMRVLANTTNIVAEGEVLQLMNMHDASLSESDYLRVIQSKTAKLFEASTQISALLAQAPAPLISACAEYGQALGTAFQIIDDALDYDGDAAELGKNLGDDLREGKITLPLIFAIQKGTPHQKELIQKAITSGGTACLDKIIDIVQQTGALIATRSTAQAEARRAAAAVQKLPPNTYTDALLQLALGLTERRT